MRHHCGLFLRQRSNDICLASDFFPRWVKIETDRFTAGPVMVRRSHSCKRTTRTQVQFHSQASSVSAQRRTQMKAAPVPQPRVRRRWQIGKVPGRKSTEHVCSTYVAGCQCNYGHNYNISIDTERMHLKFQASSVSAQRRTPMKAAPVLQPRVRQRWQIGKVPGRKCTQHICHSLSTQLWTQL